MQAERRKQEERFIKASASHPCPICGERDWCGFNSYIASCMRVSEGAFKEVNMSNGQVAYQHRLETGRVILTAPDDGPTVLAQTATIERRNKVYRDFLSCLYLLPRHKEDLLRRGLLDWEIRKSGYCSVPEMEKPWSICKRLIDMGHDLTGIPGFYKATGLYGGTYWTFDRKPGYFIPVRDKEGRIQALQRRMDETDSGKYKLFSGHKNRGGCSCGTPAHIARPAKLKDKKVWITEGPLKSDIASKYLGAVVIGAMSAGTWRPVVEVIQALGVKEAVIAYDSDLETSPEVGRAYSSLITEVKKHGLTVSRALWKEVKGIDDALIRGMEVKIIRED